jgi:hypothetical protein
MGTLMVFLSLVYGSYFLLAPLSNGDEEKMIICRLLIVCEAALNYIKMLINNDKSRRQEFARAYGLPAFLFPASAVLCNVKEVITSVLSGQDLFDALESKDYVRVLACVLITFKLSKVVE